MSEQALSRHGIGASEIAAIAGLNPHASPWDVWLRKTGQAPEFEGNEFTEWGHRLEAAIRKAYVDQTHAHVYVPPSSLFHAERAWARATPDGIVLEGQQWAAIVQCKNVGHWVEKAWSDAPPIYVQLQEQWELFVTGQLRADVAVLIGGNDFRVYTVHRDDKVITDLVDIADAFWRKVETKTAPKIDHSDACADHFRAKLKKSSVEIVADETTDALVKEWRDTSRRYKADEQRIEEIRNTLSAQLAEAQADRIASTYGTLRLQKTGGTAEKRHTNWRLVAELLVATKCNPDEFAELVDANTTTIPGTPSGLTLYAAREWAKEKI